MTRRRTPALAAAACAAAAGMVVSLAPVAGAVPASGGTELVVTGTVERFLVDDFGTHVAGADDAALTFVRTGGGAVQVPSSSFARVPDGATVRVGLADSASVQVSASGVETIAGATDVEAGARVTGVSVVAERSSGVTDTGLGVAADTTTALTSGASHHALVVIAVPAGGSASDVTAAEVVAKIEGSVSTYWSKMTGGSVTFDAAAYPKVVTTASSPCSGNGDVNGSFAFWSEVEAETGFVEGPGKHLVVYFKTLDTCGGIAGLGTVGSGRSSGGVLWSNGYATTSVLGHELGHNLSLGHSSTLLCTDNGTRVTDAAIASCTKRAYMDSNDIMGVAWQNQGYLNGSHLRYLGLLTSPASQAQPTTSGRVTLAPLASGSGMRLLTLTDGPTHYVLEYRVALGQDAWMYGLPGWGTTGVTVRRELDLSAGSTYAARETYLLDGDPSTTDAGFGALDAALPEGQWVTLASGALRVRVAARTAAGAIVDYELGGVPAAGTLGLTVLDVSTPLASLRTGSVVRTATGPAVPLTWRWGVDSAAGTTPQSATGTGVASPSWSTVRRTVTVPSADGSVWTSTGAAKALYRGDRTATAYAGSWSLATSSIAMGGSVHRTTRRYASATTVVTGSSLAVLLQRGKSNGWAVVFVDGVRVATVCMRSASSGAKAVYATSFGSTGSHRVTVKNMSGGTSGALGFDGVVVLG
jgi:hypothetical protein